jgi:hypothetical protein
MSETPIEMAERVLRYMELTKNSRDALPEMTDKEVIEWLQAHKTTPDYYPKDENTDEFYTVKVDVGGGWRRTFYGDTVQKAVRQAYRQEYFEIETMAVLPQLARVVLEQAAEIEGLKAEVK